MGEEKIKDTDRDSLERERRHHDQWASGIDLSAIDVRAAFEASTAPENRFIMQRLGDLRGKRVLDLGSGAGEAAVYFALQGAEVVAADISPGMIEVSARLAGMHDVTITGHVLNAMSPELPEESFDIVYAANLLHHTDPAHTLGVMHRLLRPGGKACFWDPLKHNPVINVYRRMATEVRSEDENPLDLNETLRTVRSMFKSVEYDAFWLCTLWIFLRFYLIERVDPNRERYWKKIFTDEPRLRPTYLRLERLDRYLKKLPFMKRMCWNVAVVATK